MTNVISFNPEQLSLRGPARFRALATTFAAKRRFHQDVFWLKENAEFLNILQSARIDIPLEALQPYQDFYENAHDKLVFFPQYYRFLLGIVLDLEDLGLGGDLGSDVGKDMCDQVARHQLVEAELSDLQRGEAMRLLARRGVSLPDADHLRGRLARFAGHSATFAVPNRKAAYELTHIVFYLSDYGRKASGLGDDVRRSLMFTGLMALLEQNTDLLAEVCVSLRFGGWSVPQEWDAEIARQARNFQLATGQSGQSDDYHCYLMSNWSLAMKGDPAFADGYDAGATGFFSGTAPMGALNGISHVLFEMGAERSRDWTAMRGHMMARLPASVADYVQYVSETTPEFESFFTAFSRAATAPRAAPVHEQMSVF